MTAPVESHAFGLGLGFEVPGLRPPERPSAPAPAPLPLEEARRGAGGAQVDRATTRLGSGPATWTAPTTASIVGPDETAAPGAVEARRA